MDCIETSKMRNAWGEGVSWYIYIWWRQSQHNENYSSDYLKYAIYLAPIHFVFLPACLLLKKRELCLASQAICTPESVVFVSNGRCLCQFPYRSRGPSFVSPLCQEKWQPFRLFHRNTFICVRKSATELNMKGHGGCVTQEKAWTVHGLFRATTLHRRKTEGK